MYIYNCIQRQIINNQCDTAMCMYLSMYKLVFDSLTLGQKKIKVFSVSSIHIHITMPIARRRGGNRLNIKLKLETALKEGNLYEALQMIKTVYARYVSL